MQRYYFLVSFSLHVRLFFMLHVAVRFYGPIKMVQCVFELREKKPPADLRLPSLSSITIFSKKILVWPYRLCLIGVVRYFSFGCRGICLRVGPNWQLLLRRLDLLLGIINGHLRAVKYRELQGVVDIFCT